MHVCLSDCVMALWSRYRPPWHVLHCGTICLRGCGIVVAYLRSSSRWVEYTNWRTSPLSTAEARAHDVMAKEQAWRSLLLAPFDCSRAQWTEGYLLSTAESAHGAAFNIPSVDWNMDSQLHLVWTQQGDGGRNCFVIFLSFSRQRQE
jgi:hypothetical protein